MTAELSVHQAWSAVMEDVREIRKAETNTHQKYQFRGIDAVMNAVGPVFRRHGISCVPARIVDSKHRDFVSKSGTAQHEAIVTVEYRVTGPGGDSFTGEAIGESADSSDKATAQAMSVALRTFLLQGLTMPTDDPDPDHNTVDRAAPDPYEDQGWDSPDDRAATFADLSAASAKLPGDLKAKLRGWVTKNGLTATTLTVSHAEVWKKSLDKAQADPEPEPEPVPSDGTEVTPSDQGWKSKAERTRTFKSLMERLGRLDAFEAEIVQGAMMKEGVSSNEETFTKAHSVELLALLVDAESLQDGHLQVGP